MEISRLPLEWLVWVTKSVLFFFLLGVLRRLDDELW